MVGSTFGYAGTCKAKLSARRFHEDIEKLTVRLHRVHIENTDWEDCIKRYDSENTLIYCDPPYFKAAGYGVHFGIEQYTKMAEMAKGIKGKMIISVNDIPEMRQAFEGFQVERLQIKYSLSKTRKLSYELLIRNF